MSAFVLQAPDLTKWIFTITANGNLKSYSGAAGSVADIKVSGGSHVSGEASFGVNNNGELEVRNDRLFLDD